MSTSGEKTHTPTPWFVSGVRFKMNGGEWQSINRYDEARKQDENIACVGYDPRTGLGFADAHFIVRAVNCHDAMLTALKAARELFIAAGAMPLDEAVVIDLIHAAIALATPAEGERT